mmetsp:Transcript_45251/g.130670  ORF Transcript_45251/g.130670 Transcript_45251/m.130670 type:complete len:230 (-) Transcript_45251:3942-4631(-)
MRHSCCRFLGASRITLAALPHMRSRSVAAETSTRPVDQVTLQRPMSGATLVTTPGPWRASVTKRGQTLKPFVSSRGLTWDRAPSGEKGLSRARITRRFAKTSQRWIVRPGPVATQSVNSPSSLSKRTASRFSSISSPLSSATRTRLPTKPVTVPRWGSTVAMSSTSSTSAMTASPTRIATPLSRRPFAGSAATMCHTPLRASAAAAVHDTPSSKSDVRQTLAPAPTRLC